MAQQHDLTVRCIIDMPLYITANLGLPERLAGLLMGTAAGLEIPIMLLAGYSVKRFGKRKIMLFAVLAGGHLFGFFGILLALPVAAVIAVLLRHAQDEYLQSKFYDD